MPTLTGAKHKQKTRHHSNLRPKAKHSKDFLKVYYPYLPLLTITLVILAIMQPWQALATRGQDVLPYATQMSIQNLVGETNERRAAQQAAPLQLNAQLTKAAQTKAQDMVERNYWSHNTPEGNAPWEFVNNAGYSYAKAGENLAYGFNDEDAVVGGWMNSPSHRANMLDANYQEVGFGFAESPDFVEDGPSTVVVAMYGQPSGATPVAVPPSREGTPAYNTLGLAAEPADTGINRIQSMVSAPAWLNLVIAGLVGALIAYLVGKHSRSLKRRIRNGEKFVLKHPLLDVTIMSLVILGIIVSQQVGIIR